MVIKYKQKCIRCKEKYVLASSKQKYVTCYECQKNEMEGKISDPKFKKMFDIPEDYYKENSFLRSIKVNYLRYGSLSDKQISAFKEIVEKLKD
ncbi:MAG: hypothetical protein ABIC04_00285 [Nanoarchaeota archaeon]